MSYIVNDETLNELRDAIDIVDLISKYVNLKKSGSNYTGICPFHSEKTPSFSVSETKKIFHCFGCGVGGDQITFIMKIENLGFIDTVIFLADKYNIKLEEKKTNPFLKTKKEKIYEANLEATKFFRNTLSKNKIALNYLKSRKINIEIINKYFLGYSPNAWDELYKHLKKMNFEEDILEEANLISKSKKGNYIDRFRNRIMFPIFDIKNKVIGFGGRNLNNDLPKYLNTSDTIVFNKGKNLYNLNIIFSESKKEKILLVEGYMDVISLYKNGINYSVASLGTSLTGYQVETIKRFGKEVFICYDGDSAGIKATTRAIDILLTQNIKPKIVLLPEGLDPDEYISKYGKFKFELQLKNAINFIEYKIMKIKENFNLKTSEGLSGFLTKISKIFLNIKNPIEREIYIKKISNDYNISSDSMLEYIYNLSNNKSKIKNNKKEVSYFEQQNLNGRIKAEIQLIKYGINDENKFNELKEKIQSNQFKDLNCRIIYDELQEFYNSDISIESFLDKLKENKLINNNFIDKFKNENIALNSSNSIIDELLNKMKKDELEEERQEILNKIRNLNEEDKFNINDYLLKLNEINSKLKS